MNKTEGQFNTPSQENKALPEQLSFNREQLEAVLENPDHAPEEVLDLLDADFNESFAAGIGVWEGYSLREHTLMVMNQFRKYFQGADIGDKKLFEFILALHDIGKPKAVSENAKHKQHEYTKKILLPLLTRLGYEQKDIALAESLIDGDAIGGYLKGNGITESANTILNMAQKSGLPVEKFWNLLTTYYQVDAGSYTEDAGGLRSLDFLFSFAPESKTMAFAPQTAEKISALEKVVKDLAHFEGQKRESILERREIIAPPNFASVFHETKSEFLPAIDKEGLRADIETKNIGSAKEMAKRNALIDQFCPENLKEKGVSRSNIYAYPFLERGNGFFGAAERFKERKEERLRAEFEDYQKYSPQSLRKMEVNTAEEYAKKMTNPEYLRAKYPGEVIELKVAPQKCYVGDLENITRIMDLTRHGWPEDEAVEWQAKIYWRDLMTLEEFIKWYKEAQWAEDGDSIRDADQFRDGEPLGAYDFYPIKGAPKNFPWRIIQPEILIPENIPQDHIRIIK